MVLGMMGSPAILQSHRAPMQRTVGQRLLRFRGCVYVATWGVATGRISPRFVPDVFHMQGPTDPEQQSLQARFEDVNLKKDRY